jgi:DnaJ-related protein SCJ1
MKEGPDLSVPLEVTLEDLYLGKTIKVLHKKQILCTHCRGSGAKNPDDVEICPVCKGKGVRIITQQLGPGFVQQVQTTCDRCGGKGQTVKSVCPHCKGKKVEHGSETLTIILERGMADGQTIVFRQQCDEAPDTQPGDLTFVISTLPHHRFTRKGNDLYFKTTISLLEALVGFSKQIPHLDGHLVTIESKSITIPGAIMKIEGEGMPHHDYPSFSGNLFVEFTVQFPDSLTSEQKKVFQQILR